MRPTAMLLVSALSIACVSRSTYDASVNDAASAKATHLRDAQVLRARIDQLNVDLEKARLAGLERDAHIAYATEKQGTLQKKLDEQTAINQKLSTELQKLGKDVDALLAEGGLGSSIPEAKKRLAELRKAQAAAEARAALYRDLTQKLKKMVDAGDLSIELRDGRMVLDLPNDVLFDSGKSDLKPGGKATLDGVALAIKTVPRKFQVAGHTDDEPIKLSPYASNWELSSARALSVVTFFVSRGLKPGSLSAAGYGEFDPVASNATPKGRARNRRIEITVQTQVDELVAVP